MEFVYHLPRATNLIAVLLGYSTLTPSTKVLATHPSKFLLGALRPFAHFEELQKMESYAPLEVNAEEGRKRSDAEIEVWVNENLAGFRNKERKKFIKAAMKERNRTYGK